MTVAAAHMSFGPTRCDEPELFSFGWVALLASTGPLTAGAGFCCVGFVLRTCFCPNASAVSVHAATAKKRVSFISRVSFKFRRWGAATTEVPVAGEESG